MSLNTNQHKKIVFILIDFYVKLYTGAFHRFEDKTINIAK